MVNLKKLLLIPFVLLISPIIFSQEIPKPKSSLISIEEFSPKDISKDIFRVSIRTKKVQELKEALESTSQKKLVFDWNGKKLEYIKNSLKADEKIDGSISFLIKSKSKIDWMDGTLTIFSKSQDRALLTEASKSFKLPERNNSPGKQPHIIKISPEAGKIGDTITILGENLGNDLDTIFITIHTEESLDEGMPPELLEIKPFYLSQGDSPKEQELKFNLHGKELKNGFWGFKKGFYLSILVNGRPGDLKKIVVLSDYWKYWMIGFTIFLLSLLHIFISRILGKTNYIAMLLLDKNTNTYSLSRFQALTWTILLLGGYFYITISTGVLLGNGVIPDFNPSLIGLLSISYGGLITAHSLGTRKPKNEIIKTPPLLSNLFSSGESIDLPRLQLFSFTILGIIIYVYNLFNSNPLNGLPDIPATFLGLLGVSQTGYITGKFVSDKIAINQVKPYYIPYNSENVKIHIIGAGFVPNMKVLLDNSNAPISVEFINSNAISFVVPDKLRIGMQKITFLHSDFAPYISENSFEVFDIEPIKLMSYDSSSITLTSGKIPVGTELEIKGTEETYRVRGTHLPGEKMEFKSPNLPPGIYELTIFFKEGQSFEKVKFLQNLDVTAREAPTTHSIVKIEEIGTIPEEEELPDRTEMPWYMDSWEEDQDLETQSAIELEEEMEGELKRD